MKKCKSCSVNLSEGNNNRYLLMDLCNSCFKEKKDFILGYFKDVIEDAKAKGELK